MVYLDLKCDYRSTNIRTVILLTSMQTYQIYTGTDRWCNCSRYDRKQTGMFLEPNAHGATKLTLFAQLSKLYAFVVIVEPDYKDPYYLRYYSYKSSEQVG